MKRNRLLIALGGLIHYIRKFLQRARKEEGSSTKSENRGSFGYAHAEEGCKLSKDIVLLLSLE